VTTAAAAVITADDVLDVVRAALAVVCERDPATITAESMLADLGADSLALVEVAEIVEEELAPRLPGGLRIPDTDLERLVTVGDAVAVVLTHL
jgi:acyl carrier protein